MPDPDTPSSRGYLFGRGLLVAFGWYATLVATVVVALAGIPERPRQSQDCDVLFNCVPPGRFALAFTIVVGIPTLVVVSAVSVAVLAGLVRVVRSAVAAGTLTAASTVAVLACGVGLLVAALR